MRHPLVPSIEVLGAIPLDDLNDHSLIGTNPTEQINPNDGPRQNIRYSPIGLPGQILLVDRLPRRRRTTDCEVDTGFIAAWRTHSEVSQGVLLDSLNDALQLVRLAVKGIHSADAFVFRAASISKVTRDDWTIKTSIVVDSQLRSWRTSGDPIWDDPWPTDPALLA